MHLVNLDTVDVFGIHSSGDAAVDAALAKETVDCQLTIATMAEMVDEGCSFSLVEPEKSVVIYEILVQHLKDIQEAASLGTRRSVVPAEDLRKLNTLANEIYKGAARYIKPGTQIGGLMGRLSKMGTGIRKSRPAVSTQSDGSVGGVREPSHTGLADAIARRFGGG